MAPQQMMTEKDKYLAAFEQEYQTTLKVLRAFPPAKAELKPSERSMSARELAWTLTLNQMIVEPCLQGRAMPDGLPPVPPTWGDVMTAFENSHTQSTAKLAKSADDAMNGKVHTIVGPKTEGDMRVGDMLWMMLQDTIHHRGQFSVYLRMAGGKVPSIYGPSGDEPWD